uniref:Do family serine endopeptidase n=1 Tax=Pararhizobium sp. IMCC3301 TaxID=3067904 RepID=UPI002741882C|nr:Do family serine endopeptidase [Pararhizobium sp. IMCC3301]
MSLGTPTGQLKISKHRGNALRAGVAALGISGIVAAGGYFTGTSPVLAAPVRVESASPLNFADVVEQVQPAVVSVKVRGKLQTVAAPAEHDMPREFRDLPEGHPMRRFFERRFGDQGNERAAPRRAESQGSGFFISEDGLLVTNEHVVNGAEEFTIVLDDGTEFSAKLIGADKRTDLALLKVDADREFKYVSFAEQPSRVGEWVVAVGNPFGLGGTVTAGIVSANGRDIGAGPYDDFIQIDAPVNRGNSGGPAFNMRGEVIGVNAAIFSPSGGNVGIAFAIPASTAKVVIADLQDDGAVERGWLGVQIQPVSDEIAESLGLELAEGALVTQPQDNSPAGKAGIRAGDTILAVDGTRIEGPKELARLIASYAPDAKASLTIWRNGKEQDISVTLGSLNELDRRAGAEPGSMVKPASAATLGLTLESAENGVVISEVDADSPAAEKGLVRGDVILNVDGEPVTSVEDVTSKVEMVKKDGRKAVLMQVQSERGVRFVAVPFAKA